MGIRMIELEDEDLLQTRSFDEVARRIVARACFEAEEGAEPSPMSTRPTVVVFDGEPWT